MQLVFLSRIVAIFKSIYPSLMTSLLFTIRKIYIIATSFLFVFGFCGVTIDSNAANDCFMFTFCYVRISNYTGHSSFCIVSLLSCSCLFALSSLVSSMQLLILLLNHSEPVFHLKEISTRDRIDHHSRFSLPHIDYPLLLSDCP